jgi:hypothetical protein
VYRAVSSAEPDRGHYFVANASREESDLTPLSALEREQLTADGRMRFLESVEDFQEATLEEASRTEMWWWLMFAVLGLLAFEVMMTRRLVQGGHEAFDFEEKPARQSPAGVA